MGVFPGGSEFLLVSPHMQDYGDPARYGAGKVSDESFVRRRILIGIPCQDCEQVQRLVRFSLCIP